MQDSMKGNPEESLKRALAEFATETGRGVASRPVRERLRRELRSRVYRRWTFAALAVAAALSAVVFGVATGLTPHVGSSPASTRTPTDAGPVRVAPESAAAAPSVARSVAKVEAKSAPPPVPLSPRRTHRSRPPEAAGGDWRKGEIVLSPWYYNTALPPAARSVMVRTEVDASTAMRFGVVTVGDKAPVEVLFGEDGLPRAMRFVRRLPTQSN